MATRANNSPGPGSSASSTLELPGVHGLSKNTGHPEQWTLPHEWNIEKREMFENWRMDVQNQIAHVAGSLTSSLRKHPRGDVGKLDYTDVIEDNELKKKLQERERLAGRSLNFGLARVPMTDRVS